MQEIIRTGGSNPITTCNDGPFSSNPTCGWALDANGSEIYASQGFCCSCPSSALVAATFTSGTSQGTAANPILHRCLQSCPVHANLLIPQYLCQPGLLLCTPLLSLSRSHASQRHQLCQSMNCRSDIKQTCWSTTCLYVSAHARCMPMIDIWSVVRECLASKVHHLCRDQSQPELRPPAQLVHTARLSILPAHGPFVLPGAAPACCNTHALCGAIL